MSISDLRHNIERIKLNVGVADTIGKLVDGRIKPNGVPSEDHAPKPEALARYPEIVPVMEGRR